MVSKPAGRATKTPPTSEEDELEEFIRTHRDEINSKLEEARKSIAAGKVAPLEPLPELLRAARRYAKSRR